MLLNFFCEIIHEYLMYHSSKKIYIFHIFESISEDIELQYFCCLECAPVYLEIYKNKKIHVPVIL